MIEKSPEGGRPVSEEECAQIYSDNVASKLEQTELFDLLSRDEEQLTGTSKGGAHQYPTGGAHLPDRPGWQVLELEGCAPVPLAGYLKALGVLRILGEQLARKQEDGAGSGAEVRGWWERERFMLWSPLDQEGLKSFFLDEYRPTPILAPWNGGSGFYKGKPEKQTAPVLAFDQAESSRFADLSASIRAAFEVVAELGFENQPTDKEKQSLVEALRSRLPDAGLVSLDATAVLTSSGLGFPPLLGSGGNDGNFEFGNNFLQRLLQLFDPNTGGSLEPASDQLCAALFAENTRSQVPAGIGQFIPRGAGGANTSSESTGKSQVNPWDFVLLMEGALLFASRASRRLEAAGDAHLTTPFTVRVLGAGSGAIDASEAHSARAESWLPVWTLPASMAEVASLMGEGRVHIGRRTAGDAIEFARAVAALGVTRGVDAFERYGFLKRFGNNHFATPLGRIKVRRNPQADLIDELDQEQWLSRFRRFVRGKERPARLLSLARRLDDTLFELARGRIRPIPPVQVSLLILGEVQDYLAVSPQARDAVQPVPCLSPQWFEAAQDDSREFDLAAALGGLHAREERSETHDRFRMPIVENLWSVRRRRERGRLRHRWSEQGRNRAVWGPGGIDSNLAAVLHRRLLDVVTEGISSLPLESHRSVGLPTLAAWLDSELDDRRVEALVRALALVELPTPVTGSATGCPPIPAGFAALKPLFTPLRQLRRIGFLDSDAELPHPDRISRLLAADRVHDAVAEGIHILRVRRVTPPDIRITGVGVPGPRLLSCLIAPLSDGDLRTLLEPFIAGDPERKETNSDSSTLEKDMDS